LYANQPNHFVEIDYVILYIRRKDEKTGLSFAITGGQAAPAEGGCGLGSVMGRQFY